VLEFPFNKDRDEEWPQLVIPKGASVEKYAKALLMRAGSYEAACEALKQERDWLTPNLKHACDDRVLLDIAHSMPLSDNAALTEMANKAYRGKAATAALRQLRYALPRGWKTVGEHEWSPLMQWWIERWGKVLTLVDIQRRLESLGEFRRRRLKK